jgi:TPP-dependent pyruvate/acetoin dehydrogenase alpha subunit
MSKNFYGGNAIVCGHLPIGAGMALAFKKQKTSAVVFLAKGAAAGEFHEAMNRRTLKVPVLFVCDRYAMGTEFSTPMPLRELKKGPGYGIELGCRWNGFDGGNGCTNTAVKSKNNWQALFFSVHSSV